jgi:PAS domain S-box-containing protein
VEFANAAAERLYGYGPGELTGLPLVESWAEGAPSGDEEHADDVLHYRDANSDLRPREHTAKRKDGTEFPVEIKASRYLAAGGAKLIAVVRDVSVRRANDLALRRNRENLARSQRMAALGSFDRDLETGELSCSEEFLRIWGLPLEVTRPSLAMLVERVHPQDRENFIATRVAILSGKTGPQARSLPRLQGRFRARRSADPVFRHRPGHYRAQAQ